MQIEKKISLLSKAAIMQKVEELSASELDLLAQIMDLDSIFENFPEEDLRKYRDKLSGQPIQGRHANRDENGKVVSCSFVPFNEASRAQLYEGLIFFYVNPAARNLTQKLFHMEVSDFAMMSISSAAAWSNLADTLTNVKGWSKYLDVVINPGEVLVPFLGFANTSNLLVLDNLIYNSSIKESYDKFFVETYDV